MLWKAQKGCAHAAEDISSFQGFFFQNENRTIINWDMDKNIKIDPDRVKKNKGVPLLGEVRLLENLQYTLY